MYHCNMYIFVIFPNGPFILMMANYNRYVVNVQYQFGKKAVLIGAGLFSMQTKLTDEAA